MNDKPAVRIPESHKGAFWIYGVTAMVMREPLSIFIKDVTDAGIAAQPVQLEGLRVLVVFLFLTRQFLAAGVFFDRVYLQPDSAERFPRRSYPLDFITRLMELLIAVAASAATGIHARQPGGVTPFTVLTALLLLWQPIWLILVWAAKYSTLPEMAPAAGTNARIFFLCVVVYESIAALGFGPAKAEFGSLLTVVIAVAASLASLIRSYGHVDVVEG